MLNKEEELKIIERYDTRDILMALLKSMDGYHGLPFINNTRLNLVKFWFDDLHDILFRNKDIILQCFSFQKNENRHFGGGSWAPECDYVAKVIKCKLCGDEMDEDISYCALHLCKLCPKTKLLILSSKNEEDFFDKLKEKIWKG